MSYTDYLRETRVPHDWCREIDERCKTIDAAIADQTILLDAVSTCRIVGDHPKTADLCQKREPCLRTSLLCQTTDGPILAPDTVPEIWGLSEMGIYTDLVSFQEISEVLIDDYLTEPESDDDTLNFLYYASGHHMAPLELGLQALENTDYCNVRFTYTEIDADYFKVIYRELSLLEGQGRIQSVKERRGKETETHSELIINFQYRTLSGEPKDFELLFVLGKKGDFTEQLDLCSEYGSCDKYPPYFRQMDYDRADVIMNYDPEDGEYAMKQLSDAAEQSIESGDGKIFIIDNISVYKEWALENGRDLTSDFSQHYGCEGNRSDTPRRLGRSAVMFRLK
ncbi:MAG: hypothetical protein HN337_04140 [Deltaproteobacteria bacterium]|jgi:hypothetical protein|nr:hypothetical protein [Deltaproteobacteria bacterium]